MTNASASKAYLPIEVVALQADYIVIGEIVSVESLADGFSTAGSYQFHVAEYVKGSGNHVLTVPLFRE
ncbi:MAG: hypothetical protein ACRYG7_11315 [Janthinobacterium lividum]